MASGKMACPFKVSGLTRLVETINLLSSSARDADQGQARMIGEHR